MCQVVIRVPEEVLYDTHMNNEEAALFARKMVALGYYTHSNVSIGYCSEIAGMTEEEFIAFIGENGIDVFKFDTDDELAGDRENA